jgi:4-hydroxybenzoate polyprenyltransferase
LDGTLIKSDVLLESLLLLIKRNPLTVLLLPWWLLRGRAYVKQQIARRTNLNPTILPYQLDLLQFLTAQYHAGRRLVLATAADMKIARGIADHLGIFSDVVASDGTRNLSGAKKLEALRARFDEGFDYVGNGSVDLPIWQEARSAIAVNCGGALLRKVRRDCRVREVFGDQRSPATRLRALVKAMRVHQWVKNLLIFVPLLTAHELSLGLWLNAVIAFIAFSLCSSSVYLLNDLLDLEADRQHPTKRNRPFAAGDLPLLTGLIGAPLLLAMALALALLLPPAFMLALVGYFGLTLAYSFYLKQVVLLDALVLALLYTSRIFAGSYAVDVPLSHWLLGFSMFLFLSLALVKRYSELHMLRQQNRDAAKGRGYFAGDLEQLANLGAAAGYISVLVLALYISSAEVAIRYSYPGLLWLVCPPLLYWVSRIWLIAHRGQMHHDPVVFAIKDRASYVVGLLAGIAIWLAL